MLFVKGLSRFMIDLCVFVILERACVCKFWHLRSMKYHIRNTFPGQEVLSWYKKNVDELKDQDQHDHTQFWIENHEYTSFDAFTYYVYLKPFFWRVEAPK